MLNPSRFYSTASRKPRLAPHELRFAVGVTAAPDSSEPIGVAYPVWRRWSTGAS